MVAALAACVVCLGGGQAQAEPWTPEDGDEAFTLGNDWPEGTPGWLGVTFDSIGLFNVWPSRMSGRDKSGTERPCRDLVSGWCASQAVQVSFYAILPVCKSGKQTWCVDGVAAREEGRRWVEGVDPVAYPKSGPGMFASDPSLNLPAGRVASLWNLPGIKHSGNASTYLSLVAIEGSFGRQSPSHPWSELQVSGTRQGAPGFTAILFPVKVSKGPYQAPVLDEGGYGVMSWNFGPECAQASNGSCARRYAFPAETRFSMSVRLGKLPGSFFHARLVDPNMTIQSDSDSHMITVEASPAQVPVVATWQKWANVPRYLKDYYPLGFAGPSIDYGPREWLKDVTKRVMMSTPAAGGVQAMKELSLWLRFLGDRATAVPSMWSFSTVPNEELIGADQCFTSGDQVNGLVTTNATSYSAGAPTLSRSSGSLDYQVAAPHYTRTGKVFSGSYTLALRSEVARCLYGFSDAPIQATVEVYGSSGKEKVVATSVSERGGWLTVSATGFDFSRPKISVKLTGQRK